MICVFIVMLVPCYSQSLVTNNIINIKKFDPSNPQEEIAIKIGNRYPNDNGMFIVHLSRAKQGGNLLMYDNLLSSLAAIFHVVRYDETGKEEERGQIEIDNIVQPLIGGGYTFVGHRTPVALIELKTDSDHLPSELRNKWIWAIVLARVTRIMYEQKSIRAKLVPDGQNCNDDEMLVTPIR